ncbi:putative metalloprotease CJM1_0395 family protein [Roseibium sp. Sym1]|uniref:putative metalloprotease CJM1_0395 family protein n=1 Tax=Roseibium sp. Sym1 TaxID=3016006 RepID=UPI0022B351B6|nr:putative metalloprotease CJM1_0395 family protein [Roseibium sp. Sym1]
MIGALLSNTPANLLKSSGVAGVSEPGTGETAPGRDQVAARDSLASSRAATVRAGSAPPLTAEAVVALQGAENSSDASGRASGGADEAGSEEGEAAGGNPATANTAESAAAQEPAAAQEEGDSDGDGLNEAEEKQVEDLKERDREVRAHEQAHARVGGAYAGAPSYTFQQGPDGKRYAVGGEVQIDTSKERTPEATVRKMQIVIRAATAPAEPSSQDLKVAQQARSQLSEAQAELRAQQAEELSGGEDEDSPSGTEVSPAEDGPPEANRPPGDPQSADENGGTGSERDDRQSEFAAAISAYESASQRAAGGNGQENALFA